MLYLVTDDQLDARRRLGISESDPDVARVQRGSGSITVVGLAGTHAVDVLYRSGPGRFGKFDAIIMDTPPVKKGGCLPGVLLIAPTDGDDASANLIRMLRATPANTDVVLVRIDAVPRKEWERDATTIHDASNHAIIPPPRANQVVYSGVLAGGGAPGPDVHRGRAGGARCVEAGEGRAPEGHERTGGAGTVLG